jgi:hypothetical protein
MTTRCIPVSALGVERQRSLEILRVALAVVMMKQVILDRQFEAFFGMIDGHDHLARPLIGAAERVQTSPFGSWRQLTVK